MKRRLFLKTTGNTLGLLLAGGVFASQSLKNEQCADTYPYDELSEALNNYYKNIFDKDLFNINQLPHSGRMTLVDEYEIEVVKEKNTIFDIAEIIIERTKKDGFDATDLLKGKIPAGMNVSQGSISYSVAGKFIMSNRIPELKNYDALLTLKKPVIIKYQGSFSACAKETEFTPVTSNEKIAMYRAKTTGSRIFINKMDNYKKLVIENLDPLKFNDKISPDNLKFNKGIVLENVSVEFKDLIKS